MEKKSSSAKEAQTAHPAYRIETLAIGDELLTGKISDTNSQYIANELFQLGFSLQRSNVVPDNDAVIQNTLRELSGRCDLVFCFGGLGPTSDDRTAQCVADLLGSELVTHDPSYEKLVEIYTLRKREITPQARKQVLYPKNTVPFLNSKGMAPGFEMKLSGCTFFFFPGVPLEMKAIFQDWILSKIQKLSAQSGVERVHSKVFRCMGIFESDLQRKMDAVESSLPKNAWLGYRTVYPENHLVLYWKDLAENPPVLFSKTGDTIRGILGDVIYSEKNEELEEVVVESLKQRKLKIALAESCTGGLTAQRLTRIPGCSEVLWAGITPYQFAAKNKILGLDITSAEEAMSMECSVKLAERLFKYSDADIVGAVTGRIEPNVSELYFVVRAAGKLIPLEMKLAPRNRYELQWGASSFLLNLIRESIRNYSSSS